MMVIDTSAAAREASAAAVRLVARSTLSFRARLGYVALLLVATGGALAIATLWGTEPALPARTHAAFAALTAINLGWAGFAAWVLGTRRVLLGYDRVVAGRMAVVFSGVFVAGMGAAAVSSGRPMVWGGVAVGGVLVAISAVQLARASRRFADLAAQRDALARQLGEVAR